MTDSSAELFSVLVNIDNASDEEVGRVLRMVATEAVEQGLELVISMEPKK